MIEFGNRWNASKAVDEQVEGLLQQMSLEEKVNLVSGLLTDDNAKRVGALPAGLPLFALADGPAGLRLDPTDPNEGKATALPAPIALAATWDPEQAARYGDLLGAEAVASGHNILLGPAVDIARVPVGGRTFESFGEDPLLQARLVVAEVQAIQAHSVQACLKHYIVNNQEYERSTVDVQVDERTLQEIYLPPFAAAVREGQVASVMASYNKINGTYACENRYVLTSLLREQLGFRGWVMSDYMANHSTAESANAGLDWELSDMKLWGTHLLEAAQAGKVRVATIDEMVRRILRPTVGLGLLDHPPTRRSFPIQQHGEVARAIAEQAMVLLKNQDSLLPLAHDDIRSIAVIGPDADNVSAAGGGSARVIPTYGVSVLQGLREYVGEGVRVEYAPGTDPVGPGALLPGLPPVPSGLLTPPGAAPGERGVRAEYWANPSFEGEPNVVRIEPTAELNRGFFDLFPGLSAASPKVPAPPKDLGDKISVRWTGSFNAPTTGDYTLSLTSLDSARLYLDGELVITVASVPKPVSGPPVFDGVMFVDRASGETVTEEVTLHLVAGEPHSVKIEYAADSPLRRLFNEAMLRFGWRSPVGAPTPLITEAAALAQQSDVAIVVVRTYESEGMDRPNLRLPNQQDRLIQAVAEANPRTIVVLMTGGPVEVASWEQGVPAIVEAWYAGQEQGNALARVLFGDINPSGRLPLTFPRGDEQTPVASPEQYPGRDGIVNYTEGIFVGYRGYDHFGVELQYPFGYGLSYTIFAYSDLQLVPASTSGTQAIRVIFAVTNTGHRAGTETAQVYLGLPETTGEPPKRLAGWARVPLEPGERQQVTIMLDPKSVERPLSYWNTSTYSWEIAPGDYRVFVGASSRDIRLDGTFHVEMPG